MPNREAFEQKLPVLGRQTVIQFGPPDPPLGTPELAEPLPQVQFRRHRRLPLSANLRDTFTPEDSSIAPMTDTGVSFFGYLVCGFSGKPAGIFGGSPERKNTRMSRNQNGRRLLQGTATSWWASL